MILQYSNIEKNNFICRFGEKGNNCYIILKGKVVFLVPKIIKCYLNESEYMSYLIQLKTTGENELLRNLISINRQYYDLGDDFDDSIRELLEEYNSEEKKKKSPFITPEIYEQLIKIVKEEENNNNENINDEQKEKEKEKNIEISIEEYLERTKVKDMDLDNKDRKRVNVYMYQITNYYEDGQIFGMAALESKFGKRTATAISLEECELGLLTKEQFSNILEGIHLKSLETIFNLINSYNILGFAPKKAFDNRYCHMFKCVRFKRGTKIMEENKTINSVTVFNKGEFKITLNKNIFELNELVVKLHKIRGKMLGLNENAINKSLSNSYSKDFEINQQFILPETMKMYKKKYNFTISIVNDRLVIGLLDTVDQENHLPYFNCECISQTCDGYQISNNSLSLVNKEYPCLNNTNNIFLINIEYYLKRLHLHIKEIENKIEAFNKNLKYEVKKNKGKQNINNDKDLIDKLNINENDKIENKNKDRDEDEESFDIRRNTLEMKKKKNNNQISLVQIVGKTLKNDYSIKKSQRFNTIEKNNNNDSSMNINSESRRYENIKTLNDDSINNYKEKKLYFINKVKKSIKFKEYLLNMAQNRSQKFMEKKKAEMRSLNIARNKQSQKNKYIDISSIFNDNKSSKDKNNQYGKSIIREEKRKDFILDSILNNLNKNSKYENLLKQSYISKYNISNNIKEKKENEEKLEENSQEIINNNNISYNESNSFSLDEKQNIFNRNKSISVNKKGKEIKYPLIKFKIKSNTKEKHNPYNFFESRNIATLGRLNTQIGETLTLSKSSRKIYNYNKIITNNNQKKTEYLNSLNNNNYNDEKVLQNKLPNIISVYNKEKINYFDPFIYNKKYKTLEN